MIGACLLAYPVLLLTVKGGMNAAFFLLSGLSIFLLLHPPHRRGMDRDAIAFGLAMCSGLLAIFLSHLFHAKFEIPAYDAYTRLMLAILVFLALRRGEPSVFALLQYAFPLGALAALAVVIASGQERATAAFIDLIHFGDLALLLGLLSLFSLHWMRRDSRALQGLKFIGLAAGAYVSVQTGSRGGWIAIPFLFVAWVLVRDVKQKTIWILIFFAIAGVAGVTLYTWLPIVHSRIDQMTFEISEYLQGRPDLSIGVRLQQWAAAWHLFLQNPIFGIGMQNIGPAMEPLVRAGLITEKAGQEAFGELHSDIIAFTVRYGILGFLAMLSIYLVPGYLFAKASRSESRFKRTASTMGLCTVVAFFVFGLTVENFNLKMVAAFYGLTVAVLLAAATNQYVPASENESHV